MDGENNEKPYFLNKWMMWGVLGPTPIFLETSIHLYIGFSTPPQQKSPPGHLGWKSLDSSLVDNQAAMTTVGVWDPKQHGIAAWSMQMAGV